MAYGLFATLIIGTIIQQIGNLIGGNWGTLIYQFGKFAAAMTVPELVQEWPAALKKALWLFSLPLLQVW